MPRLRALMVAMGLLIVVAALQGTTMVHGADPEVTVTQCYVSKERVDVGSEVTVGFRLVWTATGEPLSNGHIVVDGQNRPIWMDGWAIFTDTRDVPYRKVWDITSVYSNWSTRTFEVVEDLPVCIFDRVKITLIPEYGRTNIGEEPSMIIYAHYAYNYETFTGSVKLNYTDNFDYIGTKGVTAVSVEDPQYGIKELESNTVKITWDRIKVQLYGPRKRFNPGSDAKIDYVAHYESDLRPFVGIVTLNDTLTKDRVGSFRYTVESINDWYNGISVFSTNKVSLVFDKVIVDLDVGDDRINVGETADIRYTARYAYDGSEFMGDVSFKVLSLGTVGKVDVTASRIVDKKWFLDTFDSNSVDVIWDRVRVDIEAPDTRVDVGEEVAVEYHAYYEYDGTPLLEGEAALNRLTCRKTEVDDFTFRVEHAYGSLYDISVVEADEVTVVWDRVEFEPETPITRILGDSSQEPTMTGVYAYDGAPFTGSYTLEYVDRQGFKTYRVKSMTDKKHGLEGFTSAEGACLQDSVSVNERVVQMMPGTLQVVYSISYESDKAPVPDAVVNVNGQPCVNQGGGVYTATLSSVLPMITTDTNVVVGNEVVSQLSNSQILVMNSATVAIITVLAGLIAKRLVLR